jgi:hypothetical protein
VRSSLTPPESPGAIWGSPTSDLEADLDAAFEALETAAAPPHDVAIVIGGRRIFLVKSFGNREWDRCDTGRPS